MGRPPVIPAEKKARIVLSVLAGEVTIVQAARKEKGLFVSEGVCGVGDTALDVRGVVGLGPHDQ